MQLFGTQFEDLEANVLPVLAGMKDSTIETKEALSQITKVKYDNLSSGFEGVKRSLQGVFLPAVSEVSSGVTDLFSELSNGINEADGDFEKISKVIGETVGGITALVTEQLPQFVTLGLDIVTSLGGAILDNLPVLIDAAMQIIMTLLSSLIESLPQLTEGALYLVMALVEGIIANLPALVEAALLMIVTLASGIGEALPQLIPAIVQAIILIVETIMSNMDQIILAAFQIIKGLVIGLFNALPELDGAIPKIVASILLGLGKLIPSVVDVGRNITRGLWDGIHSMLGWVKDKVGNFAGGIVDKIKDVLGIASPSKVFAGIGGYMAEGLGEGFTDEMDKVSKDLRESIPTSFESDMQYAASPAYATNLQQSSRNIVEHTGTIRVEGINDNNQLQNVVDIIMDELRREVRMA